jgi:ubiquinone/menaquinone biosynthesis C-methylase UbiE
MTRSFCDWARVTAVPEDGAVVDVGCGFGGTLDHLAPELPGRRLTGINIDHRQLRQARELLEHSEAHEAGRTRRGGPVRLVAADGCALPLATRTADRVLALECVFHFTSRKRFFREVARVLRPMGRLALTDFVVAPGSLPAEPVTPAAAAGPAAPRGRPPPPPPPPGAAPPRRA